MSGITTHILDVTRGRPAARVPIMLEVLGDSHTWTELGRGKTDNDGRLKTLLPAGHQLRAADYRLTFDTATYFRGLEAETFYPLVQVMFTIRDPSQNYHVPLLLSAYGYSTYRGS